MAAPRRAAAALRPWDALLDACARLPFVPHDIAKQLDAGGHYEMPFDDEFPFAISLFHYRTDLHTRGSTWHERLELFVPVEGRTLFRMGEREFDLKPGDLLVVDNLKLHHVVDFDSKLPAGCSRQESSAEPRSSWRGAWPISVPRMICTSRCGCDR